MTKIIIFISLSSCILLLPESIWEKLWIFTLRIFESLKSNYRKNPFQKEANRGDELLAFFPQLEAKLGMGLKTTTLEIPRYKFYTNFLFDLLGLHQKRGISLKTILPELRGNLIKDLQFEKKLMSSTIGGNLQFLVIAITTWSFIFFSSAMVELPLKFSYMLIIILMELAGIFVFNFVLIHLKGKVFSKFDQSIERLYTFVSLSEIGLPITQTLNDSKVLEGGILNHKDFVPCASRLNALVKRWSENGISPKAESSEIVRELWHLKEVSFERFLKHLDLLKFIVLAAFFLPAYFFYLYAIFQFFMEQ